MRSHTVKFFLDSINKLLKFQDTPRMLGRWSSSIDKRQWELYAGFANNDNCCCSYSSKIEDNYLKRNVRSSKYKQKKYHININDKSI